VTNDGEEGSITRNINDLIKGRNTDAAAQALWARYNERLVRLAWNCLRGARRTGADEEEAALSALNSFFQGAAAGRYPRLGGRDDLWRLLVMITTRKVADQIERELAKKRDRRRTLTEAELKGADAAHESGLGLEQIIGREPSPAVAAALAEECVIRLNRLNDDSLRQIALFRILSIHRSRFGTCGSLVAPPRKGIEMWIVPIGIWRIKCFSRQRGHDANVP
jgi:ECF sigma factor